MDGARDPTPPGCRSRRGQRDPLHIGGPDDPGPRHCGIARRRRQALDSACRRQPDALQTIVRRFVEVSGRGRRGSRLLHAMLEERLGDGRFAQSSFETLAVRLVRSIGLPKPALQHEVRNGAFVAYLDLAWPRIKWGIECDSLAWHSGKRAHEWDRHRRRQLKQLGWDLVEITYDDVTRRRHQTGAQLRNLYDARKAAFCLC